MSNVCNRFTQFIAIPCAAAILSLFASSTSALDGVELFREFCVSCHGDTGGGGHAGGPSLLGEKTVSLTNSEIFETIRGNRPVEGMPNFGETLNTAQALAVGLHVRKLQGLEVDHEGNVTKPAVDPLAGLPKEQRESIVRGQQVFKGRGRCFDCHSIGNEGGQTAPELTLIASRMTPSSIQESIESPSLTIAKGYEARKIVTNDGRTIVGWSRSLPTPDAFQIYDPQEQLWTTYFIKELKSNIAITESLMPANLLDQLSERERLDLMAYLLSLK